MHIKRNNNIPLSMADALVDLVRRYVVALDANFAPSIINVAPVRFRANSRPTRTAVGHGPR